MLTVNLLLFKLFVTSFHFIEFCKSCIQFLMLGLDPQTWTWDEPDRAEQVGSEKGAAKDSGVAENPLNPTIEEQNKWDDLLQARYEYFGATVF